MLDPADDLGKLLGRGIGVVAHLREHAAELAVHARGQVAGGDGLQQGRQRLQIAVGCGHQLVEALDHDPEVELETLGVAAGAEVAVGSGLRQLPDLAVHRRQVGLHLVHGLGECRFLAGQAVHVLAEVADRVTAHDLRQLQLHRDMRIDHAVGFRRHATVVAGEHRHIHAVADLAGVMALGHVQLCGDQVAQLFLHAMHRAQQTASFVVGRCFHVVVQFAARDRFRGARGAAQRHGQAAGDQPGKQRADHNHRHAAADQHDAAAIHRQIGIGISLGTTLVLPLRIHVDRLLPLLGGGSGLLHQHRERQIVLVLHAEVQHLLIGRAGKRVAVIDLLAHVRGSGIRNRNRIEPVVVIAVARTLALDGFGELEVLPARGRQDDVAQVDGHIRTGLLHLADVTEDGQVALDDGFHAVARLRQGHQPGDNERAGKQDEHTERRREPRADVVALKKSDHGTPI